MPENAAAEGGFGLGAGEAFGGGVGTGSVSASAVGGAFGGGTAADFGGGDFGGGNPAAQAQAASNAVSVAQGIFGNTGVQQGLLGMAANLSASHAPTAPGLAPGFDPEAAFGMMAPGLNPSTGGFMGMAAPGMAPSVDASGYAMADVAGVNSMSPADVAAIGTQVDVDAAMNRGGLQSGNFGPGLLGGTVSSANLASGNTSSVSTGRGGSITSTPGSLESMSFGVPEGMLSPSTSTPSQMSTNMANDMSALAAAQAVAQANQATTPAISVAPATNVSPATIAQDISRSTTAPATTTTAPTAYSEKGLLGRIAQDLAMGFSINPFASREDQAAQLAAKGYSQDEIQGYFGRTDASIARDAAARAEAQGAGGRDDIMTTETPAEAEIKKQMQGFTVPRRAFRGF